MWRTLSQNTRCGADGRNIGEHAQESRHASSTHNAGQGSALSMQENGADRAPDFSEPCCVSNDQSIPHQTAHTERERSSQRAEGASPTRSSISHSAADPGGVSMMERLTSIIISRVADEGPGNIYRRGALNMDM
jgi:hypothetical protein